MDGDLDELIDALVTADQAERLQSGASGMRSVEETAARSPR